MTVLGAEMIQSKTQRNYVHCDCRTYDASLAIQSNDRAAVAYAERIRTETHICVINSTIIIIIQYNAQMSAKIADVRVEWFDKTIPIILDSRCLMYVSLCVLIISEIIYIARSFYLYSVFTTFTYYSYDALVSHSYYVCFLAHTAPLLISFAFTHTHSLVMRYEHRNDCNVAIWSV